MFPVRETIQKRKSVRTFDGEPLSAADHEKLERFIEDVPNPFGTEVHFRMLTAQEHGVSSPVVVGADTYIAAKATKAEDFELGYGYSFETVCLYAASMGVGTVILAASLKRSAFEAAMELGTGEVMPVATPVGYAASKRSIRERAMRRGLKADDRLAAGDLFFQDTFGNPLTMEGAGVFGEALEMVRWAPSATNRQPWRAVVSGKTVHFFEKRTLGLSEMGDVQKVDMGIALAHFDLTMQEMGEKGHFTKADPGLQHPEDVHYTVSFEAE